MKITDYTFEELLDQMEEVNTSPVTRASYTKPISVYVYPEQKDINGYTPGNDMRSKMDVVESLRKYFGEHRIKHVEAMLKAKCIASRVRVGLSDVLTAEYVSPYTGSTVQFEFNFWHY